MSSAPNGSDEPATVQPGNKTKEQLTQQRIVSHMNSDHRDTLSLFLEVYNNVPSHEAQQQPRMEEICLSGMTISTADAPTSKSRTHFFVPFEPALNGYDEARQKVVEMHKHCLQALGRSDITIQEYRTPTGFAAVNFTACLLAFISFSRRANFQPGSLLYSSLLHYVPRFAAFCSTIQPMLISIMLVIHATEAMHMWLYRLRPHNVRFGSRLWFSWMVNDFIEGITALWRFDALVAEKRAQKAQHKPNLKQ